MKQDQTIVLREFSSLGEASIVQGLLEANGIESFLSNVNSPFTGSIMTDNLSGIRLHIFEADLEASQALLNTPMEDDSTASEE